MSHSHAKRKRRNYTWCAVLFALVGTACMLFGIIRLLWPEITEPADLPDHSQPYSAPASEPGKNTSIGSTERGETTRGDSAAVTMNVPVLLQDNLPTGCEATAAAMMLQAFGYAVSNEDVARALPLTQQETVGDRRYAAHPEKAFLGNPFTASGFGIFSPAVAQTMQTLINERGGRHRVVDLKGASEEKILSYIQEGTPVCIWSTMDGREVVNQYSWYIKDGDTYTDQMFVWPGNEHCLVLIAYDKATVTVNDPQQGVIQYERSDFFRHYREIGRYALTME